MQNNRGNFSNIAFFCPMRDFFAGQFLHGQAQVAQW